MRTIVTNYTFTPGAANVGKVVLNGYTSVQQANILLILDATKNTTIYNPTTSGTGGTVSGNTLTLAFDTSSGYSSSDVLVIFYEDLSVAQSTYFGGLFERLIKRLANFSWVASASGPSLNSNVTNTVAVSGTVSLGAGTAAIGSVVLGAQMSQAGQSQAFSQNNFQNSFRRNLTPV